MNRSNQQPLPIVAILTIDDNKEYFRGNRDNFADIITTGNEMGYTVYIVTIKDLKLNSKRVIGYRYDPDSNVWQQEWFPLPQVIYNRIPMREDEIQPAVRNKLNEILIHPHIRMYNPFFFNKRHLFEWLKKSRATRQFIPNTQRLSTSSHLSKMLNRHSYVFLKPESGKAGMGIMTVKLNPTKALKYRLKIQDKKGSISYKCASISKLWTRVRKEVGANPYIVQQGITLALFNRRPFDLRLLIQKNSKGMWDVTGVGARVAGESSITTHVPRGGSIDDPEKLLVSIFGIEQAKKIIVRAKNAALIAARQVERGSGHLHGEMSMDLGVDANGGIWFFEANAKPMKFDEPHIRKRSLERIFQYSTYLARPSG
ncbi:YheC/YheD family endospore coat-associated protein [Paenibacillus marinisediminis]